jgi:hypothetical protein
MMPFWWLLSFHRNLASVPVAAAYLRLVRPMRLMLIVGLVCCAALVGGQETKGEIERFYDAEYVNLSAAEKIRINSIGGSDGFKMIGGYATIPPDAQPELCHLSLQIGSQSICRWFGEPGVSHHTFRDHATDRPVSRSGSKAFGSSSSDQVA